MYVKLFEVHRPFVKAVVVNRLDRLTLSVKYEGSTFKAYLANPGRLTTVLRRGREALLAMSDDEGRRTKCDVFAIKVSRNYVMVSSSFANKIFEEAINQGLLHGFEGYSLKRREVALPPHGRIDFTLSKGLSEAYVEVKSCTEVVNGVALFPDAPTKRGRRHLRVLSELALRGFEAYMVFIVQRPDAESFKPFHEADPEFSKALLKAYEAGVKVRAYKTLFKPPIVYLNPKPLKAGFT